MALSSRRPQSQPIAPPEGLDTDRLTRIIRNVEDSLAVQEISLSASKKAALIAALYVLAAERGMVPDKMTTDRLVWMA